MSASPAPSGQGVSGEVAWGLHEAVTAMGIDPDPLSQGMVLNVHLKRKVTETDKDALLAAIHASAIGSEVGDGQDRKFAFRNGQFVNRVSGEPIPHDEPIIIFRARDHHSIHVLREYLTMATDEHHRQAIRDRMAEFSAYATAHPELMKEPGITHHIELNAAPAPSCAPGEVEREQLRQHYGREFMQTALDWAVERWNDEVANRPLQNVHRRSLDDAWRQVIWQFGGIPSELVGPSHDERLAALSPQGLDAKEGGE